MSRSSVTRNRSALASGLAAVLLHAAFVAWLLLSSHAPPPLADTPSVNLDFAPLEARLQPKPQPQPQRSGVRAAPSPSAPELRPILPQPSPRRLTGAPSAADSTPAPAAPAPGAPAPLLTARPATSDEGDALRAIAALYACHTEGAPLDEASRKRCEASRRSQANALPHIADIPVDKRAAYDLQAAADARRRAHLEGPLYDPFVACKGAGSNFGTGCLAEDAHMTLRPH